MKKIPKSFIGFIVFSALTWFVMNMSRTYKQVIPVELIYTGLVQNRIYNKQPIKIIDLEVEASGFRLFKAGFSQDPVEISLKKLNKDSKKRYYISLNKKFSAIQKQLVSGLLLKRINQDVIYFDLGELVSKKVALVSNLVVDYKLGFDATEINIVPDSVNIFGIKSELDKITFLDLEAVELKEVSEDFEQNVNVLFPEKINNIKLSHKSVKVSVVVDKFTEGEFEIPVFVKNLENDVLTMFPKKVKVVFKVGLKDFNKITASNFELEADYKYTVENKLSYLVPKLKSKPNTVSEVRIVPEKIDFLISKKATD